MSGPSFTEFFNDQQAQRQSSGESSLDINLQDYGYQNQLALGRQVVEEPRSFDRRDSNASIRSAHRRQGSSSSVHTRVGALRADADGNRKESLPFDPESSSTLISTAAGAHQPRNNIGDIMFGTGQQQRLQQPQQPQQAQQPSQLYQHYPSQPQTPQYPYNPPTGQQQDYRQWNGQQQFATFQGGVYNNTQSPFLGAAGTPHTENGTPSTDGYLLEQQSPFTATTFSSGVQSTSDWSQQFLGQENGPGMESNMWTDASTNGDGMIGLEDPLAELERILTNSQAGSIQPSREGTPFQPDIAAAQTSPFAPDPSFTQAYESAMTSRSTSPYPQASTSNTISNPINAQHRRSPSPNHFSPFFNKPQSPPALIIPNQQHSPSPVLPPIVTSTEQNNIHQSQQSHGGTGLGGVSGGLFPPVNPALEGLTGMAGISPIGPNADGPMIYIQPSTPISGLKDGRGVFDFKGVTHGQQNHIQQGQQGQNAGYSVPPPQGHAISRHSSHDALDQLAQAQANQQQSFTNGSSQGWTGSFDWTSLKPSPGQRPRAKSDSQMGVSGPDVLNRQAFIDPGANPTNAFAPQFSIPSGLSEDDLRAAIDNWRMATIMQSQGNTAIAPTVDPRALPGQEAQNLLSEFKLSQQFAQLQAQKNRLPPLNTTGIKQEMGGQFSPTSMAFYQQLGIQPQTATQLGTNSAPFYQTNFQDLPQAAWPHTAGPTQSFLMPDQGGIGPRRRSFAEGTNHAAAGLGTPGYGVEFARSSPFGTLDPGRVKGSAAAGHRRTAKSEDLGRPGGTGWGVGAGGTTADFLNSITANDGTLLPPARGRSHSRHSSASSARSASPALSVSSQGSSFSNTSPGRMEMPEGVQVPKLPGQSARKRVAKMKVTSVATEVASTSRRTNDGVFKCPVPGCGSTFTRHFNLKGHLRSHNDERPYKCLYDGCPKATIGFARQHDCKRHMLLHEGLRPFECEGCGKKFARLDALTRHHKSEQGQECAITHPLPTNPDGTPMSESQYKAYRAAQHNLAQHQQAVNSGVNMSYNQLAGDGSGRLRRESSFQSYLSADDRSGAEDDLGTGSGMDDYDQF